MTPDELWHPLLTELARWDHAGRTASFWLRDDDAVAPAAALDRLLDITRGPAVPLALAVIPAHTGQALAGRLSDEPHASVLVHGWSHDNHAPDGAKKQELGLQRPRDIVLGELTEGLSAISRLHAARALPVLVPPWNRIEPALIADLVPLGFAALSVFGRPKPASIRMLNANVDIMDWHGTRRCRDHGVLVGEIVARLEQARMHGADPVGLLTHHLVHDEMAWSFLENLFEITARHRACRWRSVAEMLG